MTDRTSGSAKITKIHIEVSGYRWCVYGLRHGGCWYSHLVELIGAERLDIPINQSLLRKLRAAIAVFYNMDVEEVKPIPADLLLA